MKKTFLIFALILLFISCSNKEDSPVTSIPTGYIGFKMKMKGEKSEATDFVVITKNQSAIEKARAQLLLSEEKRNLHINGKLEKGNGGYNNKWSWHFIPENWDLVEISIEVCDADPRYVEANLNEWIGKSFCPWGAIVMEEIKY